MLLPPTLVAEIPSDSLSTARYIGWGATRNIIEPSRPRGAETPNDDDDPLPDDNGNLRCLPLDILSVPHTVLPALPSRETPGHTSTEIHPPATL